jgi:hypothetical protein
MRKVVNTRVVVLVVCGCCVVAGGRMTPPRTTWDRIRELYDSGKVEDARKLLRQHVEMGIAPCRLKINSAKDVEDKLGVGVVLSAIASCFVKEREMGQPISEELVELSAMGRAAVEQAVGEAVKFPDLSERARQAVQFCYTVKANLLVAQIVAYRDAGESEQWLRLAHENLACIEEYLGATTIEALLCTPTRRDLKKGSEPAAGLSSASLVPILQIVLVVLAVAGIVVLVLMWLRGARGVGGA